MAFIAQLDKFSTVIPSSDEESPVTINLRLHIRELTQYRRFYVREESAHKLARLLVRELTH